MNRNNVLKVWKIVRIRNNSETKITDIYKIKFNTFSYITISSTTCQLLVDCSDVCKTIKVIRILVVDWPLYDLICEKEQKNYSVLFAEVQRMAKVYGMQ